MTRIIPVLLTFIFVVNCQVSSVTEDTIDQLADIEKRLYALASVENDSLRQQMERTLWDSLVTNELVPVTEDTSVLFLYRGNASTVSWNGDFNRWGNDQSFQNDGSRIQGTDIWILEQEFPAAARLDYKITLNGSDWILDPVNPHQQWSGFGPNSELRMPKWEPEEYTVKDENNPQGDMSPNNLIRSNHLGYSLNYRVYTPAGYQNLNELPVLYVTDGHEYADDRLGALPIVLDNLIADQIIEPVLAVFVDPRSPTSNGLNRRANEFATNPDYLNFYVDELIPEIETDYNAATGPESRTILGTSLGGLNATYFAFTRPDVFGAAAIQSPAYWYRDGIFDVVKNYSGEQPALFMSTGTIGDGTSDARKMDQIFSDKNYEYQYVEVPEGHSWGSWRAQLDDLMISLFE